MLSRSGSRLIRRQHSGPPRPDSGHTCSALTVSCKKENTKSISEALFPPPPPFSLSAASPCWSEHGAACSRWCRGRGICWFARRPIDLEPPALARWTPAWRAAAHHQGRLPAPLGPSPRHPAQLLPQDRTRVGRTPGEEERCVQKTLAHVWVVVKEESPSFQETLWRSFKKF